MVIVASTADGNTASLAAAAFTNGPGVLQDATISGNTSSSCCALAVNAGYLVIANSTIAFNTTLANTNLGAVYFSGRSPSSAVTLQSSIIAMNTTGPGNVPQDLFIAPGQGQLTASGADNLVIAINIAVPPPGVITISVDPKLDPQLKFNGGRTKTHALLPDSPALGKGNDDAGLAFDQRGLGYPRTTGVMAAVDIGAFEFDSIFVGAFDD